MTLWTGVSWWEQRTCPQWQPGPLFPLPFYLSGVYFQVRSQASCQWVQMASAGFRALLPTSKTLLSSQCWSAALSPPITGPASAPKFPLGVVGVGLWVLHTVCSQEDQTNTEETQGKREAASLLYCWPFQVPRCHVSTQQKWHVVTSGTPVVLFSKFQFKSQLFNN